MMTYRELKNQLDKLTAKQLVMEITVMVDDELYPGKLQLADGPDDMCYPTIVVL